VVAACLGWAGGRGCLSLSWLYVHGWAGRRLVMADRGLGWLAAAWSWGEGRTSVAIR